MGWQERSCHAGHLLDATLLTFSSNLQHALDATLLTVKQLATRSWTRANMDESKSSKSKVVFSKKTDIN